MVYLVLLAFVVMMYFSVCFRIAVLNIFFTVFYFLKDLPEYFIHKKWRNLKTGKLECYVALFGRGKTLSAVHKVTRLYKKYNNKIVYDDLRGKWVTQRVNIISNVELFDVPFTPFVSLRQLVDVAETVRVYDEEHDTLTCTLVLGDEFSVQLNSRTFKTNIDPLFLNTLLTCRHHHISLYYTSQRFNHVDALLRQVTGKVISCDKQWRFQVQREYDAYQLEYATDPTLVRPVHRFGWFVRDTDYHAYDTLACVDNLSKDCTAGNMIPESEIIMLQNNTPSDMEAVTTPSKKYTRAQKKAQK